MHSRQGTRLKCFPRIFIFYTTRQLKASNMFRYRTYTREQKSHCKLPSDQSWGSGSGSTSEWNAGSGPRSASKSKTKSCRGSKWTYWEPWTLTIEAWRLKNMKPRRFCRQVVADWHQFDPHPDLHQNEKSNPITVKRGTRIRIKDPQYCLRLLSNLTQILVLDR